MFDNLFVCFKSFNFPLSKFSLTLLFLDLTFFSNNERRNQNSGFNRNNNYQDRNNNGQNYGNRNNFNNGRNFDRNGNNF